VTVSRDLDLEADEVGSVVDPGGGEDRNDGGEAAQRRQRHRRAFLILDALDVRGYHALKKRKTVLTRRNISSNRNRVLLATFRTEFGTQIRMFLGLPDPDRHDFGPPVTDLLVRGMNRALKRG
jgi:hypothetical protein